MHNAKLADTLQGTPSSNPRRAICFTGKVISSFGMLRLTQLLGLLTNLRLFWKIKEMTDTIKVEMVYYRIDVSRTEEARTRRVSELLHAIRAAQAKQGGV